ncbi:S49 family peptidase [Paracidovorax avenae]|uniref:S49 family peptidase n=1 Tax=Paracidovorax avenae TaxID=80867 RepID=UPI0006B33A96|nr:S49 family peptidase [Paracidovorax avenae]
MTLLPHLAARLFGVPLAIHRPKLDVILAVLGPRVGLADLAAPAGFSPPARDASAHPPKIAVIPIHGTLVRRTVGLEAESGLTSYAGLAAQLDAALASPDVAAILLDIDSPGGESGGVFDLADRIRAATQIKPVWAVANDMAFSAAYALASAASKVFVSRTGGVGSIGVIAMHVDQSEKDVQDGVRYTAVFAGDRKNDLNPHEPISSEAHAFLKAEVNRIYGLFVETVARNRGIEPSTVRDTEAGLFFGQAAVAIGLADAIGTFDDALTQLLETVSPLPNLAASHSGASRNLQMESFMNDLTDPAVPDSNVAAPTGSPSQSAPAPGLAMADAVEIAQTCTLAGRTDLIAGFLEAQTAPAQVRSQLLAAQADASPEIVSRIDPQAAVAAAHAGHPASPHNPLVQAVKSRLGSQ